METNDNKNTMEQPSNKKCRDCDLLNCLYALEYSKYEPEKDKMMEGKLDDESYRLRGFVSPAAAAAEVTLFSDLMSEGDVMKCKATLVYSTKEIYLVAAVEFPTNVDTFIDDMSAAYDTFMAEPRRDQLMVRLTDVEPGVVVAVLHESEWKRAKIIGQISDWSCNNNEPSAYRVLLIDIGEYHDVETSDMYYLHQRFVEQPAWAIRASLPEVEAYKKQRGGCLSLDEDCKVCNRLLETVFEKKIEVKFNRKVEVSDGVWKWEVSFLRLVVKEVKGSEAQPQPQTSLEQQIAKEVIDEVDGKTCM